MCLSYAEVGEKNKDSEDATSTSAFGPIQVTFTVMLTKVVNTSIIHYKVGFVYLRNENLMSNVGKDWPQAG